ncbi:uncharacterized protein LOC125578595 [Brassica napus]|uniref:uncharacterized protein LOC125578595 n=1 Tax=Brassica napus TaxID=3708 RepID=UPI002078B0A0|nr:uncharacterized protein LOC125578595 [Brassica napus]
MRKNDNGDFSTICKSGAEKALRVKKLKQGTRRARIATKKVNALLQAFLPTIGCRIQAVISHYYFFFVKQSSIVYDKKIVKIFWHHCSRQGGHKEIVWHNSWGLNTRLVHANCRLRRIYFAERLYSDEELPPEFKLYLPVQKA